MDFRITGVNLFYLGKLEGKKASIMIIIITFYFYFYFFYYK